MNIKKISKRKIAEIVSGGGFLLSVVAMFFFSSFKTGEVDFKFVWLFFSIVFSTMHVVISKINDNVNEKK